jgi:hypothetical protein
MFSLSTGFIGSTGNSFLDSIALRNLAAGSAADIQIASDTINPMDQLITVLAALITLVTSVIHGDHRGPQIRSWDGTTFKVDWNGLAYQATCKNSTGSAGGGGTVTYAACELPAEWERDWGFDWEMSEDGHTLSFRKHSRNGTVWREEDFAITSAKAIGWGLFPDPPPRVSAGR